MSLLLVWLLRLSREGRPPQSNIDSEVHYNYCVYDSDIATSLGVGAFMFLLVSHVLIMVPSRCFCCGKSLSPGGSRVCAVILFITCWVFFLIAEICLLVGSVRNAYHTKYMTVFSEQPPCETLRKGVFGAGAAFVFFIDNVRGQCKVEVNFQSGQVTESGSRFLIPGAYEEIASDKL